MQHPATILVSQGRFGTPAGRVLEEIRGRRVASRDQLVRSTGLSVATVGRAATALLDAGIIREREDLVVSGPVGRPGIPVEIDPESHVVIGVHLGARLTTVAMGDLAGRVLTSTSFDRDPGTDPDIERIGQLAAGLLGHQPGRIPVGAGVVAPWLDLDLDRRAVGDQLHETLGLDVTSGDHVAAVAAAEFIHRRHGLSGATLYVYARETLGFVLAVDKGGATEVSRVASLTHFPTDGPITCGCGRNGCAAANTSDHAVARAAHSEGVVSEASIEAVHAAARTSQAARNLLCERARRLGRVVAVASDMVDPDRVVLVGQAFTGYPPALGDVVDGYRSQTARPPVELSFTRFRTGVQAVAACTVAIGPVYADPLCIGRARPPSTTLPA
jgi:predicted NBD/HSP70 family sugar kinase